MKKLALILGIVSLVAACNTVEEPSNIQDQAAQKTNQVVNAPVLNASIEAAAETKSYLNETDWSILWTANDEISAFVQNTANWEYKFAGATGDQTGTFNPVDAPEGGIALDKIYAVYPYSATNAIDANGVMTVNFPASQTYKAKSFGQGANTMVAVAADKESALEFKNACGFLMFKLYGTNVKVASVSLKGNNNEKIAGAATITMQQDGTPAVTMASDATDEIVLNGSVKIGNSSSNYTEFWFAVPPVTFTQGFTITVTTSRGTTFTKSINSEFAIVRGQAKKMAPLEVKVPTDLSFNGLSNTYIVNITGNPDDLNPLGYCFKASVAGNGGPFTDVQSVYGFGSKVYPSTAATTCAISGDGVLVKLNQNDCIEDVFYENGVIHFKATGAEGNAKITLTNGDQNDNDNYVWTWVIWCTDQPGTVTVNGTKILDRNIGAITAGVDTENPQNMYGLYYQFGNPIGYTITEFANTRNRTGAYRMYDALARMPNDPYLEQSGTFWWFDPWASSSPRQIYGRLWGSIAGSIFASYQTYVTSKTMYDPCPVGYKVPSYAHFNGVHFTSSDSNGLYLQGTDGTLFFPKNGGAWKANIDGVGADGYARAAGAYFNIWLSAFNNSNMAYMFCNDSSDSGEIKDHILSRGMGIRCVAE